MKASRLCWCALALVACAPPSADDSADPAALARAGSIEWALSALPGVVNVQPWAGNPVTSTPQGCAFYQVGFRQPVDHATPDGDTFVQRLVLLHCGTDRPMVFSPDGYGMDVDFFQPELVARLQSNWLWVEHRYFGPSTPSDDPDSTFLTIRQSSDDHHAVVAAFKQIYSRRWISTGASNGGENVVFHRRFYPDDVDATVAYVAPFNIAEPDLRYPPYIERLGDQACHDRMVAFQRALLTRQDELVALLSPIDFSDPSSALLHAAFGYRFAFWQYVGDCTKIPDGTADGPAMLDGLQLTGVLENDLTVAGLAPYRTQCHRELGGDLDDLVGLEDLVGDRDPQPTPDGYSPATLNDIRSWISSSGQHLMFIYGDHDPWTAGAVTPDPSRDNFFYLAPNSGHLATLNSIDAGSRHTALDVIGGWADVEPVEPQSIMLDLDRAGRLRAGIAMSQMRR
jgi:hypothetical protein